MVFFSAAAAALRRLPPPGGQECRRGLAVGRGGGGVPQGRGRRPLKKIKWSPSVFAVLVNVAAGTSDSPRLESVSPPASGER